MRYFFEVSYKGTNYAGFQVQKNANTIQGEVEKALRAFFRKDILLTGSSRTDAGVHALQNYFHGDVNETIVPGALYNLNSILPTDIVLKNITPVLDTAHCRFDAAAREYHYHIYTTKDPFLLDRAYYYPYQLDLELLNQAASIILSQTSFSSFSKKNSQAKTDICKIISSTWVQEPNGIVYEVKANRFLRGMVRALVATMLRVGRGKLSLEEFHSIFDKEHYLLVDFAAPPQGLFLAEVAYPTKFLQEA